MSGMSRKTVSNAVAEVDAGLEVSARVRRPGGGRTRLIDVDSGLLVALDGLVEPESRGDPMCRLRWTCQSTRALAEELTAAGRPVSSWTVAQLLHYMDYSLQGNAKEREGAQHRHWVSTREPPDRLPSGSFTTPNDASDATPLGSLIVRSSRLVFSMSIASIASESLRSRTLIGSRSSPA